MVKPLKARILTLEELQQETLQLIKKTRKQFNHKPHEEGMSDRDFVDLVLTPLETKIQQDIEMQKDSDRNWKVYKLGEAANDNNHRVARTGKGEYLKNPYTAGTSEWKDWNEGYRYRDMVNDG